MITQTYQVASDTVTINTLEADSDLPALREWFATHGRQPIALDTEGTGLNPYADDFELRHVQFGDKDTGWVVPFDRFAPVVRAILAHKSYRFWLHNALYDLLVFHAQNVVNGNELAQRCEDTQILAHLVDPRPKQEGGIGLSLKANTAQHVDRSAPDTQADLNKVFKSIDVTADGEVWDLTDMDTKTKSKLRKRLREEGRQPRTISVDEGWRYIPTYHPTYILYAGLDVIFTARLHEALTPIVAAKEMTELADFENQVQRACLKMVIRGMRADTDYLSRLGEYLQDIANEHEEAARGFGVEKIGATRQVAAALQKMGVELTETTKNGNFKVDKAILEGLGDNPLSAAILKAKRAEKWRKSYVIKTRDLVDSSGRIHPGLRSLQARTARMSVSNPPFQQLPSSDWMVRSGIVADPGFVLVHADYDQIEMRIAAAFSGEEKMIQAAKEGLSQHDLTTNLLFGEGNWEKGDKHYKIGKASGFASIFEAGPATLARQTGIPVEQAAETIRMYRDVYASLTEWKRNIRLDVIEACFNKDELKTYKKLQSAMFDTDPDSEEREEAKRALNRFCGKRAAWIRTPIGRVLPVEATHPYKVSNYYIQSTARDILAAALLRLDKSDVSEFLLLPIHDEVLAQAPADIAEDVAKRIGEIMTTEFMGVPITAEGEVIGRSWGCGYTEHAPRTPELIREHGSCCLGEEALANAA